MAVAKIKQISLLANRAQEDRILRSFQETQAVELISTPISSQKTLVEYYSKDTGDTSVAEFENESKEDNINELTAQLDEVTDAIEALENFLPKPSLKDRLGKKRQELSLKKLSKKAYAVDTRTLTNYVYQLIEDYEASKKEEEALKEVHELLYKWRRLELDPKDVSDYQLVEVFIGSIDSDRKDRFENEFTKLDINWTEVFQDEDEFGFVVIVGSEVKHQVSDILRSLRFKELEYTYEGLPANALIANEAEQEEVRKKRKQLTDDVKELHQALEQLRLVEEELYNEREREKAKENILYSQDLIILSGWIAEDALEEQKESLSNELEDAKYYLHVEDIGEEDYENVPTVLVNSDSTKPFENILEMYALPKYGKEIDPTPLMRFFYLIFFGIMSADAGYGLLLFVGATIALKKLDLSEGAKNNLKFFQQLSVGTMVFGLFYGSFFGFDLPFKVLDLFGDLMTSMGLSIAIGIVHMVIGLLLSAYQNHKNEQHAKSFTDGYAWIMVLLGAILWLVGPNQVLKTLGKYSLICGLVGMVLVSGLASKNKLAGFGQGLFGLTDITSYLGDVISYTRLTALAVAGGGIGSAFNTIVGMLPPWARFTIGILIFLGLHLFNMFISMISAYVHGLRLNYVEFFGKFFDGGGRKLEPIARLDKHIHVVKNS